MIGGKGEITSLCFVHCAHRTSRSAFFRPPFACSQTPFSGSSNPVFYYAYKKKHLKRCLFLIGSKGEITPLCFVHCAHRLGRPAFFRPPFACSQTPFSGSSNPVFYYAYKKKHLKRCLFLIGGKGEIRTPGGLAPSTVFKTAALNRSATFPCFLSGF